MIKNTLFFNLFAVLFCFHTMAQTVSIIPQSSNWKYLDNGTNQGTGWRSASFNDATWAVGNAELGYGDGDEATVVNYGSSSTNKYITTYFRKSFSIANPSLYSAFTLKLKRDDGAVVYLNGLEVARSNMPTGTITYSKRASSNITGTNESAFYSFSINAASFITGINVLAVEVHQVTPSSPDISFDIKLDATLALSCGTPSLLNATSLTSTSALLSWGSVASATSYNIRYRIVGSSTWATTTSLTATKALSGLTPASTYEFQVQAVCAVVGSFSSSQNFITIIAGTDTLINTNSLWKYLDNGTNQGTAWRLSSYNDVSWPSGNAELGYGDGDETTIVGYGSNSANKYVTTYFRKTINVSNPLIYTSLTLSVVRDDGIVVYINGIEVYRNNLPSGAISNASLANSAIGGTDETVWNTTLIPATALVAGNNTIAVEIHQNAVTSSDISFNAKLFSGGTLAVPVLSRGAYLQKLSPSSVTIRWRTDIACDSKVEYGNTISYGTNAIDPNLVTEHSITLTGLTAATKYFYSIGSSTLKLQGDSINNFYSAPVAGSTTPVRIWATGDFGNGSTQQIAVRDAYVNYTGTTATNLWIWLGDNAYSSGTDTEYQNNVFTKYPDQLKSYPLFPSPGNHDYGNIGYQSASALTTNFPYYSVFSVPQSGESGGVASSTPKFYSYNYANIHFISLDSYGALNNSTSAMYTWLQADLAANSQRWTIVYFHHTPYTKGTHDSDTGIEMVNMRTNIIPLLESYHVDLVLGGHSHINERSYLIKGHYGLASTFNSSMKISTATNAFVKSSPFDGTVYAVCGTSGQSPGATQASYPMPCMYYNNNSLNCSVVIDVNGDYLSCKYLTSSGTIADQFSITKIGVRQSGPVSDAQNVFAVYNNGYQTTVNYYLSEEANVKIDLLNVLGEKVMTFDNIPANQPKGFYRFELPLSKKYLNKGIYFVRMIVNGKFQVQKIMIAD